MVAAVEAGSPAAQAGIEAGWRLLGVDQGAPGDIIDYMVAAADEKVTLLMLDGKGLPRRLRFSKAPDTSLGLRFDPPTISSLQRCGNRCLFCFIDQNPPGLRPGLYLKDDDYRLSFLYGNFITLNRLTRPELKRIIDLRLSPLYVSVHSTNRELRWTMSGTKSAGRGLDNLQKLVQAGIGIHAQVVVCPGYNSGKELTRTILDLEGFGPNLLSLALVPVGLTAHRAGLPSLERFDTQGSAEMLAVVGKLQKLFLRRRKSRFVHAADEFYLMARAPFPEAACYEGYPQLENGVGMARIFLDELNEIKREKVALNKKLTVTVAGGEAAEPLLRELAALLPASVDGLGIKSVTVKNRFFGGGVTVSGLLTGTDLVQSLRDRDLGDRLYLSSAMLKDRTNLLLDGMTIVDLQDALQVPVHLVDGPLDLLAGITGPCAGRRGGERSTSR